MDRAPFGREVLSMIFASSSTDKGVDLAGFRIIVLPEAIAGAILWTARFNGKLKGDIPAIIPTGKYLIHPSFPSPLAVQSIEIYPPGSLLLSSAATRKVCEARSISPNAYLIGFPDSSASTCARSSRFFIIVSDICLSISYRRYDGRFCISSFTDSAPDMAFSNSSAPARYVFAYTLLL